MSANRNQPLRRLALAVLAVVAAGALAGCGGGTTHGTVADSTQEQGGHQGLRVVHEDSSHSEVLARVTIRDANGESTDYDMELQRGESLLIELPVGQYSVIHVSFLDDNGNPRGFGCAPQEWEFTVEPGQVTPFHAESEIFTLF